MCAGIVKGVVSVYVLSVDQVYQVHGSRGAVALVLGRVILLGKAMCNEDSNKFRDPAKATMRRGFEYSSGIVSKDPAVCYAWQTVGVLVRNYELCL